MDFAEIFGLENADPSLLMFIILPLGVVVLLLATFSGNSSRRHFVRRVAQVKVNHDPEPSVQEIITARRKSDGSSFPRLDELIKRFIPRQEVLRLRLSRAGMNTPIAVFVMASLFVAGLVFVGARTVSQLPMIFSILMAILGGLAFPHAYVGWRISRRQAKFIDYFPEAIDLMVRGIKAGLPIGESMLTAANEIPNPVGEELRQVTDGVRIGRKLDEVLWECSKRLDLQEFKYFTIALSIQSETGGNLAETLNNLSEVLRGRRQLKRKVKALSSEAKASSYIIGSLPFIMALMIYLVNADYIVGLFLDPRGKMMIGFGLGMIAAGVGVMYRMVKFEI